MKIGLLTVKLLEMERVLDSAPGATGSVIVQATV